MSKKTPRYAWSKQRSKVIHYFANVERVHTSTRDDPKVFIRMACNILVPAPNGSEPTWAMSERWPRALHRTVCRHCKNAGEGFPL